MDKYTVNKSIDLKNKNLSDTDISDILGILSKELDADSIDLRGNNFSNLGMETIVEFMEKNTLITSLEYDNESDTLTNKIDTMLSLHQEAEIDNGIINSYSIELKRYFLDELWAGFRDNLDQLLIVVKTKTTNNYELKDRMPSQKTLLTLQRQNINLTKLWYGKDRGNYNLVYQYFYKMAEAAHIVMYRFDLVKVNQSKDGYISLIDTAERAEHFQNYMHYIQEPYIKQGGIIDKSKCVLDDLSLNNTLPTHIADLFLVYDYIKQIIVKLIQQEQLTLLKTDFKPKHNLAYELLQKYQSPIENYGQLPQEFKENLWSTLNKLFQIEQTEDITSLDSISERGIAEQQFILENSGITSAILENIDDKYSFLKTFGILNKEIKSINRDKMDELNYTRYLLVDWERKIDFDTFENGELVKIKLKNHKEQSRIRINQMPYKKQHCLAIHSSGNIEGVDKYGKAEYNWKPLDNKVKVSNIYRDLEKLIENCWQVNPKVDQAKLLPGEKYIDCMQNIKINSSIHGTQHLHLANHSLNDYKLYQHESAPKYYKSILSHVDLVNIGTHDDAIMLKITTSCPNNIHLLEFLSYLKRDYLQQFGGFDKIDILMHCLADTLGSFVIIIIPTIALEKTENGILNPATGELRFFNYTLIDFSKNHPNLNILDTDGQAEIRDYYDFCRVEGAREFVTSSINKL